MRSVDQVDALIVADALGIDAEFAVIVQGIDAMEHDKAGSCLTPARDRIFASGTRQSICRCSSSLDAIMAGDLGARGHGCSFVERRRQFVLDEREPSGANRQNDCRRD